MYRAICSWKSQHGIGSNTHELVLHIDPFNHMDLANGTNMFLR